jgi:uncharacterized protein YbbC (DUF1343 family)
VLFEGVNVSEGRGTTLPFQLFAAPFLDQSAVGRRLKEKRLPGVALRPVTFEPVFDKWKGQVCHGFQIHVLDPLDVRPYRLGLELIQTLLEVHTENFDWLPPPYEYEKEKLPIDILLGNGQLRQDLEAGIGVDDLEAGWMRGLERFSEERAVVLLYGDASRSA